MKKLWMIAIVLGMSHFNVFGQTSLPQKYQSLLWEITGNGMAKPSYLYGTMHVSNKVAFHLNDTVFNAIKSVDMMAFEIDFALWTDDIDRKNKAQENVEYLTYYKLPRGIYLNMFKPNISTKQQMEYMISRNPRIIDAVLYRNSNSSKDYQEDTYLDLYLYQVGHKLNKKISALEYFVASEELENKSNVPDTDKEKSKIKSEQNRMLLRELTKGKSMQTVYEDSYRSGNLDLVDTINKLTSSDNYFKYMLIERNIIMANSFDSLMKNNSVFTAIGCAHLPGDSGVIELLRSKGYVVRPLPYVSTSGIDSKTKKTVENIRYPSQYSVQMSSDSSFSVLAPSKLMELNNQIDGCKRYISFDIPNGGYFFIQRKNHYGSLTDKSPDYFRKSLDSLMYESIPGEIIQKKEIIGNSGLIGLDVTNKTAKGDWQRYQFFISADEIFIFKFNGTGDYLNNGEEVNNFFKSIKFHRQNSSNLVQYKSMNGGFSIKIPSNYVAYKNLDANSTQREFLTATANNNYYYFGLSTISDFDYIEEDSFELNLICELFASKLDYKLEHKELGTYSSYPSLDATISKGQDSLDLRIVIRGNFYYLMACKSGELNLKSSYLNSLEFHPIAYIEPFNDYIDTSLHFTTKMAYDNSSYNSLAKEERTQKDRYDSDDSHEKSMFYPGMKTRYYTSRETGEIISVNFERFANYYQEKNLDDYWKKKTAWMTKSSGLVISKQNTKEHPKYHELNLTMTDTNSTRGIITKMILKNGVLYTIKTSIDTIAGPTKFVRTFFDNFAPQDTCIGNSICDHNFENHYLLNLYSTDSLIRKNARETELYSLPYLSKNDNILLMQTIADTGFVNLNTSLKARLINVLSRQKPDEILPFLEKIYPLYVDSVSIQRSILSAVANQKNEDAAKLFLKLLNDEIPISSNKDEIENVFAPFLDSLQIGAKLFPEILAFTKYQDLKPSIYKILSSCIQKGIIAPRKFKSYKDEIIRDAKYDLKILASSNDNRSRYERNYLSIRNFSLEKSSLSNYEKSIYDYCIILRPFYADKSVQTFINNCQRICSVNLNILIMGYYLKENIIINDSLWMGFLSNINSRIFAYKILDEINRKDMIKNKDINDESLMLSYIYYDDKTVKDDSIVFIKKEYYATRSDSGYVYIYKSLPKGSKVWKLSYSGLHKENGKISDKKPVVSKLNVAYETPLQYKEEIDKIQLRVKISNRKRASENDISKEDLNYYSDYFD